MVKFKVGDKVRVNPARTYLTTRGLDMVIVEVIQDDIESDPIYRTDKPCPIHGDYTKGELIKI